jgi:hypothetical protein
MSFLDGYARKLGVIEYLGVWDASTNTPALVSGVGNKGAYYVVSVSGTTNLDSISDWQPGDWVIFNGTSWQKIDTTDQVSSVAGRSGDVVLTKSDVGLANVPNVDATSRANHTGTQLAATISDFTTAVQAVTIDAAKIDGGVVSNTEFAYLDGVTSPIQTQLNGKQASGNYITALTGDVTASGPGSATATLANSGVTAGTYTSVTVDAKGRVTSGTNTGSVTRYSLTTTATATNTNATYTTVAELTTVSLPVGLYSFRFVGLMQSGSTTSGVGVRVVNGTATLSTCNAKWAIAQGANGAINMSFEYDQLATTTNITSASVQTANTTFNVIGMGIFRVTTAGTVSIQIRSEINTNAASLLADSNFIVELV